MEKLKKVVSSFFEVSNKSIEKLLKDTNISKNHKKILKEIKNISDKEKLKKIIKKMDNLQSINKYLVFWNVKLLNNNYVEIEFENKKTKRFNFMVNEEYSAEDFMLKAEKARENLLGEPQKSLILINFGYSPKSSRDAWKKLEIGVQSWKNSLTRKYITNKKFEKINKGLFLFSE